MTSSTKPPHAGHRLPAELIRRRLPRPGDTWHLDGHLDEVVLKITGKMHYLWRGHDHG